MKRANAALVLQGISVAVFALSLFHASQLPHSPLSWMGWGLLQNLLWWIAFGVWIRTPDPAPQTRGVSVLLAFAPLLLLLAVALQSPFETDFFRYEWDGRALLAGINPYSTLPASSGFAPEIVARMNYPELATVYSPLAISIFALSVKLGDFTGIGFLGAFRCLLWVAAASAIALAMRRQPGRSRFAWASLWLTHPLLLREGLAQAHYDVLLGAAILATLCWRPGFVAGALAATLKLPGLLLVALQENSRGWTALARVAARVGFALVAVGVLVAFSGREVAGLTASLARFSSEWEVNSGIFRWIRDALWDQSIDRLGDSAFVWANQMARLATASLGAVLCSLLWVGRRREESPESRAFWIFFFLAWLSPASNAWYYLWAWFAMPRFRSAATAWRFSSLFLLLPLADAHWLHQFVIPTEGQPVLSWLRDQLGAGTLWTIEHGLQCVLVSLLYFSTAGDDQADQTRMSG